MAAIRQQILNVSGFSHSHGYRKGLRDLRDSIYRDVRNNYSFKKKKIVQNNLSMCHLERKDNKINGYLRKILSNCMTFHISQSVRYVSRYQKHSNTNKIFAKKKLFNFLKSLKVPRLLYTI